MKYTNQMLIDILVEYVAVHKMAPSYNSRPGGVHGSLFERRFGGWNNALAAAGIELNKRTTGISETRTCEHCGTSFDCMDYDANRFCSRSCANRARSTEPKKPHMSRAEWIAHTKAKTAERRSGPFEKLGWDTQRELVIQEQNSACNRCGAAEWMGHALSLEVDHKNGDRTNNSRDNLEGLCPNCHSITPTWRGRNKTNRNGVTDEALLECIHTTTSIRQALLKAGLAAKGANYNRVKQLITQFSVSSMVEQTTDNR